MVEDHRSSVSEPAVSIAPPSSSCAIAIVRPEMVTAAGPVTLKMRDALLPEIVGALRAGTGECEVLVERDLARGERDRAGDVEDNLVTRRRRTDLVA